MAGWKKALIALAAAVLAVVAWFVGDVYWSLQSLEAGPHPDVEKAAHSATTEASDRAVTKQVDDRISQLRAALPWAAYLGTAVADVCSTALKPSAAIAKQQWFPVTCTRTDTVFEAFDGDVQQRLGQLGGVLGAAGWRPTVPTAAVTTSQKYTVPVTPDFVAAPDTNTFSREFTGAWVEVASAPHLPGLDGGQSAHDEMPQDPSTPSYYRTWQPYTPAQVAQAYPAHGAVLAIELSVSYATGT